MARRFAKVSEEEIKIAFFYPSDLVNTKTTIPLRVGEERWIYTSTLRVSEYIHHYSPPLRGIVVYYFRVSFPSTFSPPVVFVGKIEHPQGSPSKNNRKATLLNEVLLPVCAPSISPIVELKKSSSVYPLPLF